MHNFSPLKNMFGFLYNQVKPRKQKTTLQNFTVFILLWIHSFWANNICVVCGFERATRTKTFFIDVVLSRLITHYISPTLTLKTNFPTHADLALQFMTWRAKDLQCLTLIFVMWLNLYISINKSSLLYHLYTYIIILYNRTVLYCAT